MQGVSEPWSLPGYDVQAMIGFGATGEVWRARETATGDTVALKRLREDADPAAVIALRREAALLGSLDTPYIVRLRAVVGDVLVLDHAAGGSLAGLLARRGALTPGEVVTIAGPLSSALATAHAAGLVHGDVSPANVLFTSEGMPLLADLGVARIAGERFARVDGTAEYVDPAVAAGGDPDAASDVWALAAVCHHLLAGTPPHDGDTVSAVLDAAASGQRAPLGLLAPTAPRALVAAVEAGLAADPAVRPDAAAFASLVQRSHGAAPVRLTSGPTPPVPSRETHAVRTAEPAAAPPRSVRQRLPRGLVPVVGLALLVVAAALVGWVSGRSETPAAAAVSAAPAPASSAPAPGVAAAAVVAPGDFRVVLDAIDLARAAAFAAGDPALLAQVWVAGTPGHDADTALLTSLAAAGQTAHGVRHGVRDLQVREQADDRALLAVVDVLAEHEVRDADGVVVSRTAERGSRSWTVELALGPSGWRLSAITAS